MHKVPLNIYQTKSQNSERKKKKFSPTPIFANLVWKTCTRTPYQQKEVSLGYQAITKLSVNTPTFQVFNYIKTPTLKPVSPGLK